jgi:hypothetical protein
VLNVVTGLAPKTPIMDSDYTAAQTTVADDDSAHPSSDVEMTAPDIEYSPPDPYESPEPELHVHEPDRRARVDECEDEDIARKR